MPMVGRLGRQAASARLLAPRVLAFDAQNNLYFYDNDNHALRRLSTAGAVTTVAGSPGATGLLDGQGAAAGFAGVKGLLVLPDGNFFVLDGARFRKVTPAGAVSTLPGGAQIDNIVLVDGKAIYGLSGHGVVAVGADGSTSVVAGSVGEAGYVEDAGTGARFSSPTGMVSVAAGQLRVLDSGNNLVRNIDLASGQTSAFVGRAAQPGQVDGVGDQARFAGMGASCVDAQGNVYVIDQTKKTLRKVTPQGRASTLFQNFPSDSAVAVDAAGNCYGVRDHTIVKVGPDGSQSVLAGQAGVLGFADGPGALASFAQPLALVFDGQGNLLVGDGALQRPNPFPLAADQLVYGGTVRKVTPSGVVTTVAGVPGRTVDAVQGVAQLDPVKDFVRPSALASDASGNIYVLESFYFVGVRKIAPDGSITVLMTSAANQAAGGGLPTPAGLVARANGDIFFIDKAIVTATLAASGTRLRRRDGQTGALTTVAGRDASIGVSTGLLPGSLGAVTSLAAGPGNLLYLGSENSVLAVNYG